MILLHFLGMEIYTNRTHHAVYWKSIGLAYTSRKRCIHTILALQDKYVIWPDGEERKEIAARILRDYQLPNVVGIIDGTLLELGIMPEADDKADYSGRKYPFSLSVLIVNNDTGKIRYFLAGFPGTAHDNRIWKKTKLCLKKEKYFSLVEYLLGDSAFECSDIMVSAFKKQKDKTISLDHRQFNRALAKPRVCSEHCIGIWKGRFP